MQQLSSMDASFIYTETPFTPQHLGGFSIYDPSTAPGGKVGFKDLLRYIEGRLDGARIFRQKLVHVPFDLDHPYWIEDENFDLEYHVRHIALPKPGDWRQLCIQIARLYSRPLDMTKPLWEFTVIEGLDNIEGVPKGSFAMLQKMHHAAMDGKSGLEMSLALLDSDPKMKPRNFNRKWKPESAPSPLSLLAKAYINNVRSPIRGARNLTNLFSIPQRVQEVRKQFPQREDAKTKVPKTRFERKISPHRVWDGRSFPIADIKTIRSAFPGATVNDVMIAVVSGSMRSYLDSVGELPDTTMKVAVPISVRDEKDSDAAGNQVSVMFVGCGSHLPEAGERLRFVVEETKRSKAMSEAVGAKTLMEVNGSMPAGLMAAGFKTLARYKVAGTVNQGMNTYLTNVPGAPGKLYLAGADAVTSFGAGILMEGWGIFHTATSYDGKVYLSVLADREALPDPANYANMMQQSFDDLLEAASKSSTEQTARKIAKARPRKTKGSAK
ncbi:MAG: wax ester/triacylglycerol synthase family O-acyltransferase [Halieaceae bacterium]|nr:wax ester/triacylglycerol synthase family O-acyltransferase [Halieaceae bacterium]